MSDFFFEMSGPEGSVNGFYVVSPSNSRNRLNTTIAEGILLSASATSNQTLSLVNAGEDFVNGISILNPQRFVSLESAIVMNVHRFDFSVDFAVMPVEGVVPPENALCRMVTVRLCVMSSTSTIVRTLYARRGMVSPDCPMNVEGLSFDNVLVGAGENLCVRFEIANTSVVSESSLLVLFNSLSVIDF